MKIILSADRICDLPEDVLGHFDIETIPYHINLENTDYLDSVNIFPQDLYEAYWEKKILPKTSAVNVGEYLKYFEKWTSRGYSVIHFCLGSDLTSSYSNCKIAAEELGDVYVVDSGNLSSAVGLQLMDCRKMIDDGMDIKDIYEYFVDNKTKYHGGFVLSNLEFLKAGGRCSSLAAYGASILNIKVEIIVNNTCGSMTSGAKYRGPMKKVVPKFVNEKIRKYPDLKRDKICITHSGMDASIIDSVKNTIEKNMGIEKIYVCEASCTISTHCGPDCFGLFFATEDKY